MVMKRGARSASMTNNDDNPEAQSTSAVDSLPPPSPPIQRVSRRVATAAPPANTSLVPGNAPSPNPPLTTNLPLSGVAVNQQIAADSSAVSKPRIVVARPPLNAYLKIAIIRDDTDAVVCEDPERPGRKKQISMNQLSSLEACSNKDYNVVCSSTTSSNAATAPLQQQQQQQQQQKQQQQQQEKNANKKEIPVPTITTVKRYDRDVPPNFAIPQSYIRNICPTYEEVEEAVEYNVDAEDEYWWRENMQFGPFAKAKIIKGEMTEIEDEVNENENQPSSINDRFMVVSDATKSEEGTLSISRSRMNEKYGRKKMRKSLVKSSKSSSSSCMLLDNDIPDNSMEIDRTNSDVSAPLPPPAPSITATATSTSQPHSQTLTIEQVLLMNPKYLYSQHSTRFLLQKFNPKLPLPVFEKMMDILEKATGFESIMTNSQAEQLLVSKLPQLVDILGPLTAKERQREEEIEEQYLSRWLNNDKQNSTTAGISSSSSSQHYPTLAPPVNLPTVIHQVYNYWVGKRSKLKKPLLRRYWPPTMASDPNPHQVFRQRDKEKRRLRKKRQNDMEAYKKMKQLKLDFERLGVLCELILKREEVNRNLVELTNEYFEERWYAWTDTTGVPRRLQNANYHGTNNFINQGMMLENNVPKYFEDGPLYRFRGSKKRQRPVVQNNNIGGGWNADVRESSPIPPNFAVSVGGSLPPFPLTSNPTMLSTSSSSMTNQMPPQGINSNPVLPGGVVVPLPPPPPPPKNIVVAGHDGGYPAPNFLQPLASRDSHPITNWDNAVPSIPSYVNGNLTTQTEKFRHRPRLGRGGRIIIDRIPLPAHNFSSSSKEGPGQNSCFSTPPPAPTVVIYGSPMKRSGYDIGTLGADGPNYSVNANPNNNNLYDAKSAPKAPPAKCLADLLPKSLGNKIELSRRIEEICALGLMEDYQNQRGNSIGGSSSAATAGVAAATSMTSTSSNGNHASSSAAEVAAASTTLSEEMDEILVPVEDWMEAPEALNLYGSEQFVIGPL